MKQTKLWLTTIVALLCSLTASAHDFEVDGISYSITSSTDLTVAVTWNSYYNNYSGAVTIPSTVTYNGKTYSVTSIESYAFYYCSSLTSIILPESVTNIGHDAFGYSGITSITIPESVTSIRSQAFYGCSSLTSIIIPESVTSIANWTFYGCSSLTSITIPESVTSIGNYAFAVCESLTSITIPESVTSIGESAFSSCSSLISITIPDNVTSIGENAFVRCSSLASITVADGNTVYDSREDCNAIIETNSNTLITGCSTTIIPVGVTSIGGSAFFYCSSLTSITIPESVTNIGHNAFGYSGITSITIPESVTSIEGSAFSGTAWYNNLPDGVMYVGKLLYSYKGEMPENTSIEVKEGTLSISSQAFSNCRGLTSIIIPESVTSIEDRTFYGCSSLTSITIPESVTSIGESAFLGCSSLIDITIPEGVTSIGERAFSSCSNLTSITIPESVTRIENDAFRYCTSLKDVFIEDGSSTLSLGYNSWYNDPCTGLFYDCPLESVYLGRDLSYSSEKAHGYSPFYHEERSPEISLGNSITTIPSYLFYENESLSAITIPEGVTSIGHHAFYGCTGLTSITCMAEIPPTIDGSATFYNVPKSIPVCVPVNFVADYQTAERWKEFSNIKPITCLLTYMVDGEVYKTQSVVYGSVVTIIPAPTKKGHTFSGWSEAPETMPANDVVISGSFAVNKYLVTFKIGDEVIAADSLEYGATIIAPEAPEKEGHTFNGWGEVVETVPANDVTIEGSYSVNSYLLTYTVDGDTIQSDFIAYGTAITLPEEPTKEGYTFSGWSEAPDTMPANDVVVSGVFTINKYLVTFMIDGVVMVADSLEYGTTIVAPEVAKKDGYTFDGWKNLPETVPAMDVVVEGKYTANEYLLTFVIDGALYEMRKVRCDEGIAALEIAEREGYTLVWENWIDKMPARDYTVRGKYVPNIYKVYYYVGEELVHTAEVAYGEAIPEYIYEPTGEGDVFQGWSGDTYETMPAHDVTYTANITNGIDAMSTDNGQQTTVIYDLNGRKIEVSDLRELSKGIYIINGHKVIVE